METLLPGNETPFCIILGHYSNSHCTMYILYIHIVFAHIIVAVYGNMSIHSCIMDLCQPPGSPLVDIPPLHDLLCHLLAIQVPPVQAVSLFQVHTHSNGPCRCHSALYISHHMPQSGWICAIFFHSSNMCGQKPTCSVLLSCSTTHFNSGCWSLPAQPHILEVLFRGIYVYLPTLTPTMT